MVVLEAFKSPYIAKTNPRGLARALKLMEMEMQGHHHRGIDDARNIARLFVAMGSAEQPARLCPHAGAPGI